ncbi:MAG: helix-turn-helix transcriptional regulator [Acidobacteriota bacterium]
MSSQPVMLEPSQDAVLRWRGQVLRDARERAGLTQRELARVMSVSRATVAEAELGADLRHSTLQRYLDTLVSLSPRRLLLPSESEPPTTSAPVWGCWREVAGFVVSRVRRRLGSGDEPDLEVEGIRSFGGDLADPTHRRSVMQAVFRGDRAVLASRCRADEDQPGTKLEFDDATGRHELVLPSDWQDGLSYRKWSPDPVVPDEGTLAFTPGYPVELLELRVQLGERIDEAEARYRAWPGGPALREQDLADFLRPGGTEVRRNGGELEIDLSYPQLFVTHEIAWKPEDEESEFQSEGLRAVELHSVGEETESEPEEPSGLAGVIRRARVHVGLSQRGLAGRLGVSPTTVHNTELGKDPRSSTLQLYLRELQHLSPEELFSGSEPERSATHRELWEHYRQLYGMEAEEESKELILAEDGWAEALYTTRRLRSLVDRRQGLQISYASAPLDASAPPDEIEQEGPEEEWDDEFRTRFLRRPDGQAIHQLSFSNEATRRGVSYTRRVSQASRFAMKARDVPEGRNATEGQSFAAAFPVRRLVVAASFPKTYWPRKITARVTPTFPVGPEHDEELARMHGQRLQLRRYRRQRRIVLSVEEPLIGVQYALTWSLP